MKRKKKSYDVSYMWNLSKKVQMKLFTDGNRVTCRKKLEVTREERSGGRITKEIGTAI